MFTVSQSVAVNDPASSDQPHLTRGDVWQGLLLKAENALPFVAKMTRCDVLERGDGWLLRDVTFRGEDAREKVSFEPQRQVTFERVAGRTTGTILNIIEESEQGELALRFTFSLEVEGIPAGSPEEEQYARTVEGDYLAAVDATLNAIRRNVAEQRGQTAPIS